MYALVDAIVDHCFPIMEHYSDVLEDLEDMVLARPDKRVIQQIHGVKRGVAVSAAGGVADAGSDQFCWCGSIMNA